MLSALFQELSGEPGELAESDQMQQDADRLRYGIGKNTATNGLSEMYKWAVLLATFGQRVMDAVMGSDDVWYVVSIPKASE